MFRVCVLASFSPSFLNRRRRYCRRRSTYYTLPRESFSSRFPFTCRRRFQKFLLHVGIFALSRRTTRRYPHKNNNNTAHSLCCFCCPQLLYRTLKNHHHGGRRRGRRRAARLRGGGRGPESGGGIESRRRRRKSERGGQQEERLRRHALHGIPRFPFETGTAARDRRLRLRTPE